MRFFVIKAFALFVLQANISEAKSCDPDNIPSILHEFADMTKEYLGQNNTRGSFSFFTYSSDSGFDQLSIARCIIGDTRSTVYEVIIREHILERWNRHKSRLLPAAASCHIINQSEFKWLYGTVLYSKAFDNFLKRCQIEILGIEGYAIEQFNVFSAENSEHWGPLEKPTHMLQRLQLEAKMFSQQFPFPWEARQY